MTRSPRIALSCAVLAIFLISASPVQADDDAEIRALFERFKQAHLDDRLEDVFKSFTQDTKDKFLRYRDFALYADQDTLTGMLRAHSASEVCLFLWDVHVVLFLRKAFSEQELREFGPKDVFRAVIHSPLASFFLYDSKYQWPQERKAIPLSFEYYFPYQTAVERGIGYVRSSIRRADSDHPLPMNANASLTFFFSKENGVWAIEAAPILAFANDVFRTVWAMGFVKNASNPDVFKSLIQGSVSAITGKPALESDWEPKSTAAGTFDPKKCPSNFARTEELERLSGQRVFGP